MPVGLAAAGMAITPTALEVNRINIDCLMPFTIATLQPVNDAGAQMFDEISHALKELSPALGCNIDAEPNDRPTESDRFDEVSSDREPDLVDTHPKYRGHYTISFRRKSDGTIPFVWTFGRGASNMGEARGVTHLIACPFKRARGVAPLHMEIRCDCVTGQFYIVALDERYPVTVYPYHKPHVLRKGQCFLLSHERILIALGKLKFVWAFRCMSPDQLNNFVIVRDTAFKIAGLQVPDRIFEAFPTKEPRHQAGPCILHPVLGKGAWGQVWSAVDVYTIQPRAVKEIIVDKTEILYEIWNELVVNLSYQGSMGLMQALEIRDDRGNTWGPGQSPELIKFLETSPLPYKLYIIMCKALDFSQWRQSKPSLEQIIEMFRGSCRGLATLHGDTYSHRDITTRNMFVCAVELTGSARVEWTGALGDFGKATRDPKSNRLSIGPEATLAPEVDGKTMYTNAIDIWSMGFALLTMAQPVVESWPTYSADRQQSAEWFDQTFQLLDGLVKTSTSPVWLWRILRRMLAIAPAERPSITDVLAVWPAPSKSGFQSRVTPDPPVTRSAFNEFDELYNGGPQAGGRDQTLQNPETSKPTNLNTPKSTSGPPHKRTVSSVSDVAGKPGKIKQPKQAIESITTDTDTSGTTPISASKAEDTSSTSIVNTPVTKPADEVPGNKECKDELNYLFEEDDKAITNLELTA